jgi:hypothetical protein
MYAVPYLAQLVGEPVVLLRELCDGVVVCGLLLLVLYALCLELLPERGHVGTQLAHRAVVLGRRALQPQPQRVLLLRQLLRAQQNGDFYICVCVHACVY